ncbi:Serine/threonine protein kinase [Nannocystis exedens]|uniref:Serine/threonine protein kinase n=2 Tax=Nannocystis exedens TaxID=54 RepID=A0A1I2G5M4_9BACT|nr:serine/threonine-protein kinase [Nannocystis exedens]PCC67314.1 Serine/threonine-protein kinase PrkC [Nannocystis exedens]SFF12287.1 Serine/threonine protein kinase [Nannocystis exedens]
MKIVDVDETSPDRSEVDVSADADTLATPRLRPEVLGDAAQRRTKAMVHASLFKGAGEAPTIGPYQVLKWLGEGGMGVVYAAYDDKLERKVALKLIRGAALQRPQGRARTLREARALARLSHPNVVHVYQVGEVDDEVFVAMEFLTGPTLREWLAAEPRSWREVLAVFRQAGEGLAAAHRQGVVHRDFKPANVILGDDGRVRVVDFGLAYLGDGEAAPELPAAGEPTDVLLTQTGAVLGTPAYMAAEQFAGARGDAKTDQFSFCAALYEALYGQRPFAGADVQALATAVAEGRVRAPKTGQEVPAWLQRVVLRGLQPDPAARWPSMDALLSALQPAEARLRGRLAWAVGSTAALLAGALMYVSTTGTPAASAQQEDVAAARAELTRTQDAKRLAEARAALTRDPVETIRALAQLAGDDPGQWNEARFLAAAATARGLPAQVLRAERPLAEALPLAGGEVVGRDELGAVWRWNMSDGTGEQVLAPGAAKSLLVARGAPVWAVVGEASVQVFGEGVAQTIDLRAERAGSLDAWELAADGRSLVAFAWPRAGDPGGRLALRLWELSRPDASPRATSLPRGVWPAIAADASTVAFAEDGGTRVIRPRDGNETRLEYAGRPFALTGDARFAIAHPKDDDDGRIDVVDLETGASRRVKADWGKPVGEGDALFMRPEYGHHALWRESLATGAVVWRMQVPSHGRRVEERVLVDPAGDHFLVAIGEDWGVGDLRAGGLRSFVTVPRDRLPRWGADGALMVVHRHEVRIHRPAPAAVTVHKRGPDCALAPAARWAAATPWDRTRGEFTRIELATNKTATFRCPSPPSAGPDLGAYGLNAFVDDAGQVTVIGEGGYNCWWDEQHGARVGSQPLTGWIFELPRGVARAVEAEVEVWTGPDQRAQRFTAASKVVDLQASPSGARLAVRSEKGVELLAIDSGAVTPVIAEASAVERGELMAGALAWSPDSAQLAVLRPVAGSLELTRWDVTGSPRELERHVLKDSPGRPRNRVAFTPSGKTLALTNRHESLMLVVPGATMEVATPELASFAMRGETEALGIDFRGGAIMIDVAAGEVSPLAPNPDLGSSTNPPIRRAADGTMWACDALGPGTLLGAQEFAGESPQAVRSRIAALVAAL